MILKDNGYKRKFNINDLKKENYTIEPEKLKLATETVLRELTENKGTPEDVANSSLIASATKDGNKNSQKALKLKIKKIIEDNRIASSPLSDMLAKEIYEDKYGLGPIDDLCNENLNEIIVNGPDDIYIEVNGKLEKLPERKFKDNQSVEDVIRRLLNYAGRDITTSSPEQETNLPDGSRLGVSIYPYSSVPTINIRRHDAFDVTAKNFIKRGTLSIEMLRFIRNAIHSRLNIFIIGESDSGKTTVLKLFAGLYPKDLRIITIEVIRELLLKKHYPWMNVLELEAQPALGLTMSRAFAHALIRRPDRIVIGEIRSIEAEQMVDSFLRGHPGSMGTGHMSSPELVPDLIAKMILSDGRSMDPRELRHSIALGIDLVVQCRRLEDTKERKITRVTEIVADHNELKYSFNDIFLYREQENGKGLFDRVGNITKPESIKKIIESGLRSGVTEEDFKEMTGK